MKPFGKPVEEESSDGPDAQALLAQGQQLCEMGQSIIETAKAMGATEETEEESPEEDVTEPGEEEDTGSGDDTEDAPTAPKDPKRAAIIMMIRKKLGGK